MKSEGYQGAARRVNRRGFTMLEMLSVVLIIGMLIGLLLPAIQSAREAARRTTCGSRLAQIGLAVHAYHNAFGVLPAGTISEVLPVENFPNGYHHGWLVRILPMLDQQPLAEQVDWSVSCYDPANWPVVVAERWVLQCPSDWMHPYPPNVVLSGYAGVFDGRVRPIDEESRGLLTANRFLAREDVPDGFAYTLLASEKVLRSESESDLGWMSGTRATLRTTGFTPGQEARLEGVPAGPHRHFDPKTVYEPYANYLGEGESDPEAEAEDEAEDEAGSVPEDTESVMEGFGEWDGFYSDDATWVEPVLNLFPAPTPPAERTDPGGFDSRHEGGVNVLWGDGRVSLASETVDAETFAQIGIRDDGMPLQSLD